MEAEHGGASAQVANEVALQGQPAQRQLAGVEQQGQQVRKGEASGLWGERHAAGGGGLAGARARGAQPQPDVPVGKLPARRQAQAGERDQAAGVHEGAQVQRRALAALRVRALAVSGGRGRQEGGQGQVCRGRRDAEKARGRANVSVGGCSCYRCPANCHQPSASHPRPSPTTP